MESVTTRVNLLGDPTNHRRHPVSGLDGVKLATEASPGVNRQASEGGDTTVGTAASKSEKTSIRSSHRIGAWNVRGLLEAGKLTIVEKEMESHDISILGISETHMRGNGHFTTATGNTMYFSGCEDSSLSGVGIILPPHLNKYVLGYNPVSDRILTMKLNTNPCVLNVIQIYAPTAQAQDELIVDFYGKLEEILNSIPSREIKIILGDWNAKVGSTLDDNHIRSTVGKFGLGIRNERGEKLIEFCIERNLSIMNTYFQHHPRRLYTWRSPGDRYRNQIDYIILDGRWRSSVSNVKTFPGAEGGSDHNLLVANFSLRLKAPRRQPPKPNSLDPSEQPIFREALEAILKDSPTHIHANADTQWKHLKGHINDALDQIAKKKKPEPKKKCWISDHSWELIQRRKDLKTSGLQDGAKVKYSELSRAIRVSCRLDKNHFVEGICRDIERFSNKLQTADLFKKVRVLSRQFKAKSWVIRDADGTVLHEFDRIAERWRAYCEQLYTDSHSTSGINPEWKDLELEPMILPSETSTALESLKKNKAPGSDRITAEVLYAMGDLGVMTLYKICSHIWQHARRSTVSTGVVYGRFYENLGYQIISSPYFATCMAQVRQS
uniref:Endonuclease/exonuclease/phosphatase domain-containing protein n=1 Tax=Bombyx mori TaxID=7091 RepID=A0A8R2QU24_BOMMO|nr:uncharacterized protein LOC119628928 [Bombyx mori]